MADVHSRETRSYPDYYREAAIKGKNTKPEMLVRKFLHANGYRYKLHDKSLPGNPILPARSQTGFAKIQNGDLRSWLLLPPK